MTTDDRNRAFNEGCQARLDGRQFNDCPYLSTGQLGQWRAWRQGWMDCHKYWGRDAVRPVKPLARVV